jgi:DNA anti-recombination protein RmuC
MVEGTRVRDLQDTVTSFKLHLKEVMSGLKQQMEQTQSQSTLHGKKINELSVKMDQLIEAISTNGKNSVSDL